MNASILKSLQLFLSLTVLTGIIYPLLITLIAQITMPYQANGTLIVHEDNILGSKLIGQNFTQEKYFWGRPSVTNYNPLPSGGSNLGPTSAQLRTLVIQRGALYSKTSVPVKTPIPSELIYGSGSGLDPHISTKAAAYQIDRVAKARGMDTKEGREKIEELIHAHTHSSFINIPGHSYVNVLALNRALDEVKKP